MNISIVTGAFGLPRVSPFCGIPLKSSFASGAPGQSAASSRCPSLPDPACRSWRRSAEPLLPPPLEDDAEHDGDHCDHDDDAAAIASARGDAWRAPAPPAPFERTGGGVRAAAAACCLCCLALLPLGMRREG